MTISQMVDATLVFPKHARLSILAPVVVDRKREHLELVIEPRASTPVEQYIFNSTVTVCEGTARIT